MNWIVVFTNKARKQKGKLPRKIQEALFQLVREIEMAGPVRGNWPNYSKLSSGAHHCHLKKGRPTYVAVWREVQEEIKLVEVIYAGSHEKAPCG
jgi:mRNA-degrading endonuclease RelE of RelBE toxin-antitoxin system